MGEFLIFCKNTHKDGLFIQKMTSFLQIQMHNVLIPLSCLKGDDVSDSSCCQSQGFS